MAVPQSEQSQQIAQMLLEFNQKIQPIYKRLDPHHRATVNSIIASGTKTIRIEQCRRDFGRFIKHMWSTGTLCILEQYEEGEHHRLMSDAFNRIANGSLKRLILAMPPQVGKSTWASQTLPPWYLGNNPQKSVIQVSNGKKLSSKFGAQVRDMFQTQEFQEIFPGVRLSKSTKGKEVFNTNKGGRYVALSMEAKKAGEGAHLIIIDDPHSEQDVIKMISNPNIWDDAWQQFLGIRQRAKKNVAIVVIATRWNSRDITGRLLRNMEIGQEKWEVIQFPAIIDEHTPNERSFWEAGKPLEYLRQERAVTPPWKWGAVYQQQPVDAGMNIIPRECWKDWRQRTADGWIKYPKFEYKIQAWDTALSSKQLSNFSACTTWGTFYASPLDEQKKQLSLMLIYGTQGRWDLTDLRDTAVEQYKRHHPDVLIVEDKQSGPGLRSCLFEIGVPSIPFDVKRGSRAMPNDKMSRLNAISDLFRAGLVYAPLDEAWAQLVQESCASAGTGASDDYADTVAMCLKRFREGRFIMLPEEMAYRTEREKLAKFRVASKPVGYW